MKELPAAEWAEAYGLSIDDPDGWRNPISVELPGGGKLTYGPASLHWPLGEREFWLRVAYSTVEFHHAAAKQQMMKFWPPRDLSQPTQKVSELSPTLDLAAIYDETRGGYA
jgi:hypothetical protein